MILVTTGTNEQPFDRLVRAATTLDGPEPLVVQYGSSQLPHGRGEWVDFVAFEELAERMRAARVVVCHAGVGSVMLARQCGRRPVVLARRLHLHEAVDDHQLDLARRMDAAGIVHHVEDEADLARVVGEVDGAADAEAAARPARAAGATLVAEVRAYLGALAVAGGNPPTAVQDFTSPATRSATIVASGKSRASS